MIKSPILSLQPVKIENIKYSIEDRALKIDQSKQLINKNNELAEKLKQFV